MYLFPGWKKITLVEKRVTDKKSSGKNVSLGEQNEWLFSGENKMCFSRWQKVFFFISRKKPQVLQKEKSEFEISQILKKSHNTKNDF